MGGKGQNLSSIGDLLRTIGAMRAVKAPKAQGLGMGGDKIRSIFSGKDIKVGNALAAVNGLVNEYAMACKGVRARWPLGLGKYLMNRLEVSMLAKGVLQVDKVAGKPGNYVYMNGRSVGLSSKLQDFASLASRMSVYESVLAKLTAKLPNSTQKQKVMKVGNALAAVNGLVNEYAMACKGVRARWPLGLGKYLMNRLEVSMLAKGVLQVDKVAGKPGNYVYMNG